MPDIRLLASSREGLPRALMQYLAGSKPVVASDLPGIDDVLRHDVNGPVASSDDLDGLADAVIALLEDDARRSRLARGAATTELEWDAACMGERIEAVYADVIREEHRIACRRWGGYVTVNALLAVAVLSLMLLIRWTVLVLVRPFEFLIALGISAGRRPQRGAVSRFRRPAAAAPILLLARRVGHGRRARRTSSGEGLQVLVVTLFAFLLAQEASRLDMTRLPRRLLLGMVAIAAGTILWHFAHGYWVGWKQLLDPRLAFVFLPAVLAGLILSAEGRRRRTFYFVWAGMFPAGDVRRTQGAGHLPHPDGAALARARPARPGSRRPSPRLLSIGLARRSSRTRICRSRSARSSSRAAAATTNTCSPTASICRATRRATSNAPSPSMSPDRCSVSIRSSASAPTST